MLHCVVFAKIFEMYIRTTVGNVFSIRFMFLLLLMNSAKFVLLGYESSVKLEICAVVNRSKTFFCGHTCIYFLEIITIEAYSSNLF